MSTITNNLEGKLNIGKDFVDCETGKPLSHGSMVITASQPGMGIAYTWQSTLNCVESEHALRLSTRKEGKRIISFTSQAL